MPAPSSAGRSVPGRLEPAVPENPFLGLSEGNRLFVVGYVVAVKVLTPGLLLFVGGSEAPLAGARFVAEAVYTILLLLPLFVLRRQFGWLHPLLFPLAWSLVKGAPSDLSGVALLLGLGDVEPEAILTHPALVGWPQEAVASAYLKESLLSILAISIYYLGYFFGPRIALPRLIQGKPRGLDTKLFTLCAAAGLVCAAYIVSNGGISAFMSSWAAGRFRALEFDGPVHVLIRVLPVAVFAWYALRPDAFRRPLFLLALVAVVPTIFLSSGSRSGILYTFLLLALTWMLRHRSLPSARMLGFGAAAFVLFGMLGAVRGSVWEGDGVNWSVATEFDWRASFTNGLNETRHRKEIDGAIGVVGRVGQDQPLLMGESYVAAALFFVPRALWPDKPRGAGAIYVSRFYGLGDDSYGIPVGPAAEAFWNFHLPGVVVVFLIYGAFHRWLARLLIYGGRRPLVWAYYLPTLLLFSPGTDGIVPYLHFMVILTVILVWTRVLRFGQPGAPRHPTTRVRGLMFPAPSPETR